MSSGVILFYMLTLGLQKAPHLYSVVYMPILITCAISRILRPMWTSTTPYMKSVYIAKENEGSSADSLSGKGVNYWQI